MKPCPCLRQLLSMERCHAGMIRAFYVRRRSVEHRRGYRQRREDLHDAVSSWHTMTEAAQSLIEHLDNGGVTMGQAILSRYEAKRPASRVLISEAQIEEALRDRRLEDNRQKT
jgi:hypothetical protein